jgi:hypothetical protein
MERLRSKLSTALLLSMILIAAAGCKQNQAGPVESITPTPTNPSTPPAQEKVTEALPVQIQLTSDSRLQAPIQTLVSPSRQEYLIQFGQKMNTASVEETLKKQRLVPETDATKFDVLLSYRWDGDRKLYVTAEPQFKVKSDYPVYRFKLDVSGAMTASGTALEKPPVFEGVVDQPAQLWRISTDGQKKEQLSSFADPFWLQPLSGDRSMLLAMRTTGYCECDATFPKHYSLYNIDSKQLTHYPVTLHTTYQGPGNFVADTRGFFYEATTTTVPSSNTIYQIKVDGYVHGASISKDRKHVLMAVSKNPEEIKDLDFILYRLGDGTMTRMSKVLTGQVPQSQVSDAMLPVSFTDNGKEVRAMLVTSGNMEWAGNVYSWEKGTWSRTAQRPESYGSDDGVYEVDSSEQLYQNGKPVQGVKAPQGFMSQWLPSTHSYTYIGFNYQDANAKKTPPLGTLYLYDADKRKAAKLLSGLSNTAQVLSASSDGKWIYLLSRQPIQ